MKGLSHVEREQLRAAAIAEIAAGVPMADVAAKYGYGIAYVRVMTKRGAPQVLTPASVKAGKRDAILRELSALGISQKRSSQLLGCASGQVCQWIRRLGITMVRESAGWAPYKAKSKARAAVMAALYKDGYTLQQVGDQYGITRERVRQLIGQYHQMTGNQGGLHVQAERSRERREAARDAKTLAKHGCTWSQLLELRRLSKPLYAFQQQRRNARIRGIGWEFNVWQWWTVWQQSGHWAERGRGQGYVMCRKGDTGPYAVGNVYIATAAHNSSEGSKRVNKGLPIGVRPSKNGNGRFSAHRSIDGRKMYLGTHDTPELAYAAYLMAAATQGVAA